MKAPLPVVADVHPRLALTEGGGDGAVSIDHRLTKERWVLLPPDVQTRLIDRLHQRKDLLIALKPAAEVAGGGRIGNARRAQRVQIRLVIAKPLQIFDAGAADHRVVRQAQHLSLIHISEPTRQAEISYAVFCL